MIDDPISVEVQLLRWSETSNGGATLTLQLPDADALEPFRCMTLAKGRGAKAIVGQRLAAVFVVIGDDEQPEPIPQGPLCRLAVMWCREPEFHKWLARTWPTLWKEIDESDEANAKHVVCRVCEVTSRKQLDHDGAAKRAFNELIRRPYAAHVAAL